MTSAKRSRLVPRLVLASLFARRAVARRAGARTARKPPALGPPPALKLPPIQKRQLSNGLPVWIVELHEVPVAQVNLVVLSGTRRRSGRQVRRRQPDGGDARRRRRHAVVARDRRRRSISSAPISARPAAIDSVGGPAARAGRAAAGGAADHGRRRAAADVPEGRARAAPPAAAHRAPAGARRPVDDRVAGVLAGARTAGAPLRHRRHRHRRARSRRSRADDLRAFYASHLPARQRHAASSSATSTPDKVLPLLETSFGAWKAPGGRVTRVTLPEVEAAGGADAVYLVDKPGAPQSQIRIGWLGVPRSTPDYFPIQVLNTILGGVVQLAAEPEPAREARLHLRRERRRSTCASRAGPFSAAAGVQTDKTVGVAEGVLQRAERHPAAGAGRRAGAREELRRAAVSERLRDDRRHLAPARRRARLSRCRTTTSRSYVQNIQAVTAADVQRVAQKYIAPDKFAVVVVGDVKTIEPGIRALNLGPIKELSVPEVFTSGAP